MQGAYQETPTLSAGHTSPAVGRDSGILPPPLQVARLFAILASNAAVPQSSYANSPYQVYTNPGFIPNGIQGNILDRGVAGNVPSPGASGFKTEQEVYVVDAAGNPVLQGEIFAVEKEQRRWHLQDVPTGHAVVMLMHDGFVLDDGAASRMTVWASDGNLQKQGETLLNQCGGGFILVPYTHLRAKP